MQYVNLDILQLHLQPCICQRTKYQKVALIALFEQLCNKPHWIPVFIKVKVGQIDLNLQQPNYIIYICADFTIHKHLFAFHLKLAVERLKNSNGSIILFSLPSKIGNIGEYKCTFICWQFYVVTHFLLYIKTKYVYVE